MKAIRRGAATLDRLTDGLLLPTCAGAKARRVGNAGAFMPLVIERVAPRIYSLAHYFEQNGDPMRDPEMLFVRAKCGLWYATYFRQDSLGIEQHSAEYNIASGGFHVRERLQASHTQFANVWLRNLRVQQAEWFKAAPALCRCYRGAERAGTCDIAHDPRACSCAQCLDAYDDDIRKGAA